MPHLLRTLAENVGKGLAAGLVGTAAMTVSSTLEAKLRGRGSSTTPANAVESALGVEPADEEAEQRLNEIAHWGYGTGLGALRGLIATTGAPPAVATAAHLGVVLGAENVMLPATGASPPVWRWGITEVGVDLLHHAVYAVAAGLFYEWLDR